MRSMNWAAGCSVLVLMACASNPPLPEIAAGADPQGEINKLEQNIEEARKSHADVLAHKDFGKARDWLDESKSDAASKQKQAEILQDVRKGQGYLNRALQTTQQRTEPVKDVLEARQAAINAGARKIPAQEEELKNIDGDLEDKASRVAELKPETKADLQKRYLDLELSSIQQAHLGRARAVIEGAKKEHAKKEAPVSLEQAEADLKSAENIIAAKRSDEQGFRAAISKADASATMLEAVLQTIKANKGMTESAAVEIVKQQQQIAHLNENLEATRAESGKTREQLAARENELQGANRSVRLQENIDRAREEFSDEEAEVFQQGQKLVVRLKKMNFPSGKADLSPASMEILTKVKAVTQELDPDHITIEGHTDSVGSAQLNKNLSQERAESVAEYLKSSGFDADAIETVGYGYERPISSNKSKEGRAQNRRVDVVITPKAASL